MRRALGDVEAAIAEQLDELIPEIVAAEREGRRAGISLLWERGRLEELRRQVVEEMATFGGHATRVVEGLQGAGADDAVSFSREFVRTAAAALGQRAGVAGPSPLRPELVERARAHLATGSPLRELFAKFGPDAARRVEAGLVQGLALGQGPATIARRIRADVVETYAGRAHLIARTETHRVVRATTLDRYRESDVVVVWRWVAALDRRSCPACWAMHGTLHGLDEPLAGQPGCRCVMLPVLRSELASGRSLTEPGEEVFAGLPAEEQRAVLGPAKATAYDAGEIRLADMVERRESDRWGPMYREASLERARSAARRRVGA